MVSGLGGTINSATGQFTFLSNQIGDFPFSVKATDGFYSITKNFNVKVSEIIVVKPLEFTKTLPGETMVKQITLFSFQFEATGPNQPLTYSGVDNYSPIHFTVSLNPTTGNFSFIAPYIEPHEGKFIFKITVSDGVSSVSTLIIIIVKPPNVNAAPTFVTNPGTLTTYTNKTLDYQFEANDLDGDPLTFTILHSLPEVNLTSNGKLTFLSANANTYTFTVVVSDGQASANLVVSVKVDFNVAVETIIEPEYTFSIYPNPVSDNTNIKISMKKHGQINLSIYDLQGRQIFVVTNTEYEAGEIMISYDASNLKSGAYICRLITANFSKSIKIVKQ
ncbi:MAG: T9SS type A sorting domain-containing protein [Bacteroidota bacterium]|nr:T9SS type A sorting domain-containing protein [Bacteroidota bacterium]